MESMAKRIADAQRVIYRLRPDLTAREAGILARDLMAEGLL